MNVYPLEGYRPQRQAHIRYPSLVKCCGCIHLRTGAGFAGLVWAGLSMYFAVLSFQNKSPFYSYLLQAPLLVFGVANLILSCVGLGLLFAVYVNRWHAIRTASSAVFVSTFMVAGDAIANAILFIATKPSYIDWCISSSSGPLDNGVNNALNGTLTTSFGFQAADYYNCSKTWENELKFGILSTIMLTTLYASI
ncbi:hypothetical protein CLU79DRAFT_696184 [Phycomyces nitens]|nr:hypothetical protein CLU79DRAFT_696184 [Phycomyces nitens]